MTEIIAQQFIAWVKRIVSTQKCCRISYRRYCTNDNNRINAVDKWNKEE